LIVRVLALMATVPEPLSQTAPTAWLAVSVGWLVYVPLLNKAMSPAPGTAAFHQLAVLLQVVDPVPDQVNTPWAGAVLATREKINPRAAIKAARCEIELPIMLASLWTREVTFNVRRRNMVVVLSKKEVQCRAFMVCSEDAEKARFGNEVMTLPQMVGVEG
jgi:hypothetical protein